MIKDIFKDDFAQYDKLYNTMNNINQSIYNVGEEKSQFLKNRKLEKENLYKNIVEKWDKIEFYMIGLVFIILTGLVTNQLYSSSIISLKECATPWISFFFAHIFVVLSFGLLIFFAKELVNLFVSDVDSVPNKIVFMLPVYLIPIFSQINTALLDMDCKGGMPQVGFSSLLIGIVLIKYVFDGLDEISNKVKRIKSKELNQQIYLVENKIKNIKEIENTNGGEWI
jgi:hypothetical protein